MSGRRIGRFVVSNEFVHESIRQESSAPWRKVFDGLIVIDVRRNFERGDLEYLAVGDGFDVVAQGEIIPLYVAWFDSANDRPLWRRVG